MSVVIKTIVVFLNILFIALIGWFSRDLRWAEDGDRPSLIGFALMEIILAADIWLIVWGA